MKRRTIFFATTLAAFAGSTAVYASACPAQVPGVQVTLSRGQVTATGYSQYISLQNGRQQLVGPAYLILNNVTPGATLVNRSGQTDCGAPGKAPFIRIYLGPSGTLHPDQSIQVLVTFNLAAPAQVSFAPTLVFGHLNGHGVTWGDYDGDGKADRAVLGEDGVFRVHYSGNNDALMSFSLPTQPGDIVVTGDFDGDGIADPALYRPSAGEFFIAPIGKPAYSFFWGTPGVDKPVVGDYDGDGKSDLAVYDKSTGNWKILRSTAGVLTLNWGLANVDIPVPADYDGDGVTDIAVYRPPTAQWWILNSSTQQVSSPIHGWLHGNPTVPVPADYDGDGKADLAILHDDMCNFGGKDKSPCVDWNVIASLSQTAYDFATDLKSGWLPADYDGNGFAIPADYNVNWYYADFETHPGLFIGNKQVVTWLEVRTGQPALGVYNWYK